MNNELINAAKDQAAREKWKHIPPLDVEPDRYSTVNDYINRKK